MASALHYSSIYNEEQEDMELIVKEEDEREDIPLIPLYSIIQVERTVDGKEVVEELILPCGYRFSPNDQELVLDYLLNKILGNQLSANFIKEIDLYEYDPHQLPIYEFKHGEKKNEAFFFTQTELKYTKGTLSRRTTKTGYWKATGGDVQIYGDGLVIGFKKILVFYSGKAPKGNKTDWIMHEYRVNPDLIPVDALDHNTKTRMERFVVCKIQHKTACVSKHSKQTECFEPSTESGLKSSPFLNIPRLEPRTEWQNQHSSSPKNRSIETIEKESLPGRFLPSRENKLTAEAESKKTTLEECKEI